MPAKRVLPTWRSMEKEYAPDLSQVVTISEVVERWGKHRNTVIQAIDQGRLYYEQRGSIYLISLGSVIALWGQEKESYNV